MGASELGGLLVATAAALAALTLIWKYVKRGRAKVRSGRSDVVAVRDSILGRPPVVDSITGKEIAPALPGIGQRMDTVERAVATLADQHARLEDHESRIKSLETAAVERIVTRSESAQAFRAMEAAINASPPDEEPDTEL